MDFGFFIGLEDNVEGDKCLNFKDLESYNTLHIFSQEK